MQPLTARQARFIAEYMIDLNGAAAARRAGYAPSASGSASSRLLRMPHIKAALDEAMAELAREAKLSARAVLDELAAVAFFDPGALIDEAGEPVPLQRLDPKVRAGIGTLEIHEVAGDARRGPARRIKVRPGEKVRALWLLGKHMGVSIPEAGRAAYARAQEEAKSTAQRHGERMESELKDEYNQSIADAARIANLLLSGMREVIAHDKYAKRMGSNYVRSEWRDLIVKVADELVTNYARIDKDGNAQPDDWWRQRKIQGGDTPPGWVDPDEEGAGQGEDGT